MEILVGMIDDYNGRHLVAKDNTKPVLLASFYSNEQSTFNVFMKYLGVLFPDDEFLTKVEGNYYVYSEKIAALFDNCYSFSKENIGYLNQQMFDTDERKINFIKGTFIRNGKMNQDNEIVVSFSNSLSHFQAVQDFVSYLNWKVVEVKTSKNTFPQVQEIIFQPNKENLDFFKKHQ